MSRSGRRLICAVLGKAVARQSIRDAFSSLPEFEVGQITTTVSGVPAAILSRADATVVIDASVVDAEKLMVAVTNLSPHCELVVLSDDVAKIGRRKDIRPTKLLAMPVNPEQVGPTVVTAIRRPTAASMAALAGELAQLNGHAAPAPSIPAPAHSAPPAPAPAASAAASGFRRRELLVIGCSTGGPEALAAVLGNLPADFPVPIAIVQHMPPNFTKMLAQQLDKISPLTVREVHDSVTAKRGEVWIAPGDKHLLIGNTAGRLDLGEGPPENACRPAVDPLFRTAAATYGRRTIGVILTGMGNDGCAGARQLVAAGAHVIAQDEATSFVWGMPGAVAKAGLAHSIVPLEKVAGEIMKQFSTAAVA